ncbi:anaerobic ribonucleoside-triphosphate reductase activating protein [Lachnospiraceae bacterium 62-35]
MKICGFQKTTLLDFPGHIAATVFLGSCNFRCPFCHNSGLLKSDAEALFTNREILSVLEKRASILEGVCITGGEPTFSEGLEEFIRAIRSLGLAVKLDTNGYRPDVLKHLCSQQLLDYIAMDIKAGPENYPIVSGIKDLDINRIHESISFLKQGTVPYEFRTTVVKGLLSEKDFSAIGPWIQGAQWYFLQNYVESDQVLHPGFESYSVDELLFFASLVRPYVEQIELRGVDH